MCVKRLSFGRAPRTLCLHLRRAYWTSTGRHIKLSGHVRFPLTLSTAPYSAASLPPLSRLSQQYIPDDGQSFWLRSAGRASQPTANSATPTLSMGVPNTGTAAAAAGAHHTADSKPQGKVKAADGAFVQPTAGHQSPGSFGEAAGTLHADAAACEGKMCISRADVEGPDSTGRAVRSALSCPHDDTTSADGDATACGDVPAHSKAGRGAQNAAVLPAETPQHSRGTGASSAGEDTLRNSRTSVSSGDAPWNAEETATPQRGDSSAHGGPVAHSAAGKADGQGVPSSRAGQVGTAGPVRKLLASHALSSASSLTSESSLLSDTALEQDTEDEPQHPVKLFDAEQHGAGPQQGKSATQVHQGRSSKGPLQRVLASHALSLASSLTSQPSMGADASLESTASWLIGDDAPGSQPGVSKAPAPTSSLLDARQATPGFLTDENSDKADTADVGGNAAEPVGGHAAAASNCNDLAGRTSLHPSVRPQDGGSSRVSPSPTEPMMTDDSLTAEHDLQMDASGVQELEREQYHLVAAVVHHGSDSGSGHYTVYRRVTCEKQGRGDACTMRTHDCWFSISDEIVHRVDVSDVLKCEATLLMYEQ